MWWLTTALFILVGLYAIHRIERQAQRERYHRDVCRSFRYCDCRRYDGRFVQLGR